jgi:hypothetical protein
MWCIPNLTDDFIIRMEDILDLYELQYNPLEPVICLDEKPYQLLGNKRAPIPMKKNGSVKKNDSEYIRNGTANIYCAVEPKIGRHFTVVTEKKKGPDFARILKYISRFYLDVKVIHLVMDNYCTHTLKSLTDYFGEIEGKKLWEKFKVHYTPVHASWLDQAEIEIGIYSSQCLGKRRVDNIEELKKETAAWNKSVNKKRLKFDWRFTTTKAREKFKYCRLNLSQNIAD